MIIAEESTMKVAYVKKLYAEQLKKLVEVTNQLETKDTELQVKLIELQLKD